MNKQLIQLACIRNCSIEPYISSGEDAVQCTVCQQNPCFSVQKNHIGKHNQNHSLKMQNKVLR